MTTQALAAHALPAEWAWLSELCDRLRESTASPWSLELDGQKVTMVTNGALAVMIPGDFGATPADKTAEALRKAFTRKPDPQWKGEIDWPALRAFIGITADPRNCTTCGGKGVTSECDECEGSGETECECFDCGDTHTKNCKACDGKGDTECPDCEKLQRIEPVRVGPSPFDRHLLARVVHGLGAERVTFQQDGTDRPAHFTASGWSLVVMPIRDDDSRKDAPRFEFAA